MGGGYTPPLLVTFKLLVRSPRLLLGFLLLPAEVEAVEDETLVRFLDVRVDEEDVDDVAVEDVGVECMAEVKTPAPPIMEDSLGFIGLRCLPRLSYTGSRAPS